MRTFINDRGERTAYPTMLEELRMCGPAGVILLVILVITGVIALAAGALGLAGQIAAGIVVAYFVIGLLVPA